MHRHSWLIKYHKLYTFLFLKQKFINYEKLLYLQHIKKGDVVFDVGANIGYYTVLFSIITRKNGEIHAFEPVPPTFQKLLDSVKYFRNVQTINKAVGDYNGLVDVHYNLNDSEKASLIAPKEGTFETTKIPILTLDSYFIEQNLNKINFVKCDVEGLEYEVLKGFEKTLFKYKPKLSIEVTISSEKRTNLFNFLQQVGYKRFHKIEVDFPEFDPNDLSNQDQDFFYLYASS